MTEETQSTRQPGLKPKAKGRSDRGRLHVAGKAVLSRGLLETLYRFGENPRVLRRMEAELRAALQPSGPIGALMFARFFSSVLRLMICSRLEEELLTSNQETTRKSASGAFIREGPLPVLVSPDPSESECSPEKIEALDSEIFDRLALLSRYDRSASREMY